MEIYILLSEGKESCDVVCVSTDLMDIRLAIKQVLESPNYPTLQIWENGKMKTWLAGDDVLHKIVFVLDKPLPKEIADKWNQLYDSYLRAVTVKRYAETKETTKYLSETVDKLQEFSAENGIKL